MDEEAREDDHDDEMDDGRGHRQQRQTRPARHAQGSRQPDRSGRREATHDIAPHEDDAAANEANPGNRLCRDARWVKNDTACDENVGEAIFGNQHEEGCRNADQSVGAQASAFLADFALQPDQSREEEGQEQLFELEQSLAGQIEKRQH